MTAASSTTITVRSTARAGALRTAAAWFGGLIAFAGLEHGIGEILQGSIAPATPPFIESWPDTPAFDIVAGEPAFTILPTLLLAGMVTVAVSIAYGIWAIWFVDRPMGWLVLLGLSAALLLAGGGLAPPLMGVMLTVAVWRLRSPIVHATGSLGRRIGLGWRWFTAIGVVAYLGLVPGMVLLSQVITVPDWAVYALGAVAFGCFATALVAGRLFDRTTQARGRR